MKNSQEELANKIVLSIMSELGKDYIISMPLEKKHHYAGIVTYTPENLCFSILPEYDWGDAGKLLIRYCIPKIAKDWDIFPEYIENQLNVSIKNSPEKIAQDIKKYLIDQVMEAHKKTLAKIKNAQEESDARFLQAKRIASIFKFSEIEKENNKKLARTGIVHLPYKLLQGFGAISFKNSNSSTVVINNVPAKLAYKIALLIAEESKEGIKNVEN